MQPLRGEVWDARVPIIGERPVVVLTTNSMIGRLSHVTVAVITGTQGPAPTHIQLDSEAGLTRYDVSYANATDLHSIGHARFKKRRGRLHWVELQHLETAIRTYLGL